MSRNHENKIPQNLQSLFSNATLVFFNPLADRGAIYNATNGKLGIYCWVNMVNGKIYVGRGAGENKTLYGRLRDYYQSAYLAHPRNANSLICKALRRYGMASFALLILEFVDSSQEAISREQFYLETVDTPYNIQKSAGHSLGLGLGVPHSPERIQYAWQSQWGAKILVPGPYDCPITTNLLYQQNYGLIKVNARTEILIEDLIYFDIYATFYSYETAATALCIKKGSFMKYFSRNTQRPYLGRYWFTVTKLKP